MFNYKISTTTTFISIKSNSMKRRTNTKERSMNLEITSVSYLDKVGELGISIHHQPMHLRKQKNQKGRRREEGGKADGDETNLVFDLVLLGFFKSDVVLGKARLSLPVLKQDESDLPFKEEEEGIERSDLGFWEMR